MIRFIFKELVGLFVDDEFLALAILAVVAGVAFLVFFEIGSNLLSGLVLVVALPCVLILSVVRGLRRGKRPMR
jgi:hypothetical protein